MGGTYEENSIKGMIWHTLIIDSVCKPFPQRHRTFVSNCKESSVSPFTCTLLLSETPWPLVAKSTPETCIFLYKKIIQVRRWNKEKMTVGNTKGIGECEKESTTWDDYKKHHKMRYIYETETCEWT